MPSPGRSSAGKHASFTPTGAPAEAVETVRHLFQRAVREHAKRNLIVSGADGSVFTYAAAANIVGRAASRLAAEGVKKGDAICMCAPANPEAFFLFWAAASLGAVYVPLYFNLPARMAERVLAQTAPKLLFCDRKSARNFAAINGGTKTVLFDEPGDDGKQEAESFFRWLEGDSGEADLAPLSPDDPAVILYTSGSTGEPKGVVLSHGSLCRFGRWMDELLELTADDLVLTHGDPHSTGGMRNATAALTAGYSFLVLPLAERSNVFSLAGNIRKHRCTHFSTTSVTVRQFVQQRDRIDPSDLASLRSMVSAGSVLPPHVLDAFYERYHVPVLNCYGLTETAGMITGTSLRDFPRENGTIGLPVGDFTVEIVDERGNVLPDGIAGELRVRGSNLMLGYHRDRDATGRVIRNGWFSTGDLAYRRTDGRIVLTGRIRNIIKHATGDLISLEEVEAALERHPLVREAAVCGFSSERGDERMAVFVVPSAAPVNTEDLFRELRRHLKEELGAHKVPAVFYLRDALPRGATGKLLREGLAREVGEA